MADRAPGSTSARLDCTEPELCFMRKEEAVLSQSVGSSIWALDS